MPSSARSRPRSGGTQIASAVVTDTVATVLPLELTYPAQLPITARRAEIVAGLRDHQVLIVAGETGSGMSTQLP
ncbi:MAG: ATP-dependent helicase HrpA [Ilumatobacteraceae bacterium]|nr:ATP-dependent helicase HrpA [Ilumatobacteraceae bacterium]